MIHKKNTEVVKYRLFAALSNAETLKIALETAYARVANGYILLYKRGKAPKGYKELTEKMLELLTAEERAWLQSVNIAVMQEFVRKHEKEARRGMIAFGKRFEEELKAEAEKGTEAENNAQESAAGGA